MRLLSLFPISVLIAGGVCSQPAAWADQRGAAPLLPDTSTNIHVGQPFDNGGALAGSCMTKQSGVDYVWGASSGGDYPSVTPSNFPACAPATSYHEYYYPWGAVSNLSYGLSWFQTNHPDWLEYTSNGGGLASWNGYSILDVTNPAVQTFILQNNWYPAMQGGYQGISIDWGLLDNGSGAQGCYCGIGGAWKQQYSGQNTDPTFIAAQESAFNQMKATFKAEYPTASLTMNESFDCGHPTSDYQQAVAPLDMIDDEDGWTNYGQSGHNWITTAPSGNCSNYWLDKVQQDVSMGKAGQGIMYTNEEPYTVTSYMTGSNAQARNDIQWALANYLLVKYSHTYFWWGGEQQYGGDFLWQTEEKAQIGSAADDYYESQSVYMRDFTNGLALVNPDPSHTYSVKLVTGKYQDLYGNSVNYVTMSPHSGEVLLLYHHRSLS